MNGLMEDARADIVVPTEQEGTKAVVRTWLKQVGDAVRKDEPVLELETDKVVVELPAPCAGVLADVLVAAGAEATPGMVLGRVAASTVASTGVPGPGAQSSHASPQPYVAEPRLSPSVRRLVAQHGLDPSTITGTGRGGRLTREDVLAVLETTGAASPAKPHAATAAHAPDPRRIPHDSMRRRIAEHMLKSVQSAPHVTAVFETDFTAIAAHRSACKRLFDAKKVTLTYTAYFVAASVAAMKAVPMVNSRWHDDGLEVFGDVNVGVGTALGDSGLIVPVIHKAQDMTLFQVAEKLQDLVTRARLNKLRPPEVQNGTFTISNHGVSGSLLASPVIINQPQSAILGVGAVEKRVVVRTIDGVDTIQVRPMAYVTLTIDHRVIDGAQTNAWLRCFVDTLERWSSAGISDGLAD